jgi:hypothetical protein
LRLRIHRARDTATARAARTQHRRARSLYWIAAQLASDWVFTRASTEVLEGVLQALTYTFLSAGTIERVETPDEH